MNFDQTFITVSKEIITMSKDNIKLQYDRYKEEDNYMFVPIHVKETDGNITGVTICDISI